MTPNQIMQECHFDMCDDYRRGEPYAHGALDTLRYLGQIDEEQHRLWGLALKTCPGHRDGGRVWCAYCGNLPSESENAR